MVRSRKAKGVATSDSDWQRPPDAPATDSSPPRRNRDPSVPPSSSPDRPLGPLSVVVPPQEREVVKVNNANLTELKNACDDALKRFLSHPELFKQIHLHTDVRLAFGWAGVFVAAGTALYGYKVEFEKSKPVVWAGLILYVIITAIQTLYAYFIEGDIVFVGKRKTFSKRIITERLTLSSSTEPVISSLSLSLPIPRALLSASPSSSDPAKRPAYALSLTYLRSTSGGKSLLAKGKVREMKEYAAFFDEKGVMDGEAFEKWVGGVVERGMGEQE